MEGIQVDSQGIRHHPDRKQQRTELQGPAYDDPPDKILDKDDLFMGERFQSQQVLQRILFSTEPIAEQKNNIQQPDNKNGQQGKGISKGINMWLTTDLYNSINEQIFLRTKIIH